MSQENINLALNDDLPLIMELFDASKLDLLKREIFQWDDQYPNKQYFEWVIKEKEMFVYRKEDQVLGAIVLNEWQLPEWEEVKWSKRNGKVLVIHAFCVHPDIQGGGYGGKLLQFAEELAKEKGFVGIRLDAFSGNPRALKFYETRGFMKKGEIFISSKPLGHETYYCYEKLFL